MNKIPFQFLMPNAHLADLQFMEQLVALNPCARLTASQANAHIYFLQHPLPQSRQLSVQEYYSHSSETEVSKNNIISRDELMKALTSSGSVPASEASRAVNEFVDKCISTFSI
jgi:hypothetical protein